MKTFIALKIALVVSGNETPNKTENHEPHRKSKRPEDAPRSGVFSRRRWR